jgi:hypothetical protein
MKKLLLSLFILSFASLLKAQDGVYLTYEDYKNNKLVTADEKTMTYNFGKKANTTMKQNGVKKEWKLADIWGLKYQGKTFRSTHADVKDAMAEVILVGNYVYYWAEIYVPAQGGGSYKYHNYISKDLNSPVYFFTPNLETLDELVAAHKDEFKELTACRNKAAEKKRDRAEDIVQNCIKASKEYQPNPNGEPTKVKGFEHTGASPNGY